MIPIQDFMCNPGPVGSSHVGSSCCVRGSLCRAFGPRLLRETGENGLRFSHTSHQSLHKRSHDFPIRPNGPQ